MIERRLARRLQSEMPDVYRQWRDEILADLTADPPPDLRLSVPPGRPYADDFYAYVVSLYSALVRSGRPPAPLIAAANNVPVTSVHGWIKEARRRGLLGRGTVGRAG